MSITITSTVNNKEYTIKLTKHIINLFENILELDGTTTDLCIPININSIMLFENQYILENTIEPSSEHEELFKLFGLKRTVITIEELNKIEGYSYNTEEDKLTITSDSIKEINSVPFGIKHASIQTKGDIYIYRNNTLVDLFIKAQNGVYISGCNALLGLSINTKGNVYVEHNKLLPKLSIKTKKNVSVRNNYALTELSIKTKGNVSIYDNKSLTELSIESKDYISIHRNNALAKLSIKTKAAVFVKNNDLLNNKSYTTTEDGTRIYIAKQSESDFIKQLLKTMTDYLTSNEQ